MNEYRKSQLEELEYFSEQEREVFRIDGIETLTWAFKKLASITSELEDKANVAKYEKDQIDNWLKKVSEPLEHSKNFFEAKIKEYHQQVLLENPKQKSISTPFGKIKSIRSAAQPAQQDKEELMMYVGLNDPDLLKIERSVKWSELKKKLSIIETDEGLIVIDDNGQIVPGVKVEEEKVSFKVEVKK